MNSSKKPNQVRPTTKRMKRRASEAVKNTRITHSEALDAQARKLGVDSFALEMRQRSQTVVSARSSHP